MPKQETVPVDARRFLDDRGTTNALTPNGLNPATIMEKAVRNRIVDSQFYQQFCFALNEADIVDRVVDHVRFVGGTTGASQKPSPFLCLAFKLLELGPSDAVVREYLGHGGDAFKYLRALAAFYVRMTRPARDVFLLLEPYLEDRRKLRRRRGRLEGSSLSFVDDFVDDLLANDRVCATSLFKMPSRETLEELDKLEPRISPLGGIEDILAEEEEANKEENDDEEESSDGDQPRVKQEEDMSEDEERERDRGIRGKGVERRRGFSLRSRSRDRSP